MQQAIYNNTLWTNTVRPAQTPPVRKTTLLRHLALKWDLYGVVALMATSAAYGVFALAHVA